MESILGMPKKRCLVNGCFFLLSNQHTQSRETCSVNQWHISDVNQWHYRDVSNGTAMMSSLTPWNHMSLYCWAEAPIKIARMTLTIKLDGNWSSFQLANSTPPLCVTDSAIAPSARMANSLSQLTYM